MSRPFIELIAAVGPHWELGLKGGMPWGRIKGDLALFRRVTEGKAVIMGRKTWESLPPAVRPLKGRLNMILTRDVAWVRAQEEMAWVLCPGHETWGDYKDPNTVRAAIDQARSTVWDRSGIVIIGGAQIYRAALEADLVDVIHLSTIRRLPAPRDTAELRKVYDEQWPCDVRFPLVNPLGWVRTGPVHQHEPEDGATHGWTSDRWVRDPAHPALCSDKERDAREWWEQGVAGWVR